MDQPRPLWQRRDAALELLTGQRAKHVADTLRQSRWSQLMVVLAVVSGVASDRGQLVLDLADARLRLLQFAA